MLFRRTISCMLLFCSGTCAYAMNRTIGLVDDLMSCYPELNDHVMEQVIFLFRGVSSRVTHTVDQAIDYAHALLGRSSNLSESC